MILECKNVVKRYYGLKALDDLSMTLTSGKIYALLGPNGSGKSTIMKIIAGLSRQTSGDVFLDHEEITWRTKNKVAYMPTENFFFDFMDAVGVGKYYVDFFEGFDIQKYMDLLKDMEVPSDKKVRELSSGMMAKLKIAATLSRNCPLMLLDEPTNGIDLLAREHVVKAIVGNIAEDATVVISSHMVEELEKIADHIIFMHEGKNILEGDIEDLRLEKGKSIAEIYREIYGHGGIVTC